MNLKRNEILDLLLEYAEQQVGTNGKYPFAFGYVSAKLSDSQMQEIADRMQREMSVPSDKVSL